MFGYDDNWSIMSSSNADEVDTNEVMKEIREQRIVIRFDYPRGQDGP
jgi:hypothetical protein